MCGIAGILAPHDGRDSVTPSRLRAMLAAQTHRGPDARGVYLDDAVGLAHTRLSIVDLAGGAQPIHNERQTQWIVYNGEVFNHIELRAGLEQRGHRFYTRTDTEVILHLYEECGADCLRQLNGQFAFAIWDAEARSLFMARDRVGICPLHYAERNGRLVFASEAKALFASGLITPELDAAAIEQTLTFWTTWPGQTVFRNVHEVPPGHFLVAGCGRSLRLERYWDADFGRASQRPAPGVDATVEHIRALLGDAVRLRLRADVPVGAYLSGGLDSSGLCAVVARHFDSDLRTYGIRFDEPGFDEGGFQQLMAARLGVRHTEVRATNGLIAADLPEVVYHVERPLLRTAPVPMFHLARRVHRDGIKVVLTGEGADEIFGGYNIFREAKIRAFWAQSPDSAWRHLLLRRLYPYVFRDARLGGTLKAFFADGFTATDDPFYSHLIRWRNTARTRGFLAADSHTELADMLAPFVPSLPEGFGRWDVVSRAQYLEMRVFMSNYLLSSQGDRMAMGNSLELRVPYLDHRLIEFMATVPPHLKIRGLNEKCLLKRALGDLLPAAVTKRSKHPYRAPISTSLLAPDAPQYVEDQLSEPELRRRGIFDPRRVARLVAKLRQPDAAGSEVDNMALIGILTTQLLAQRYLDQPPFRAADADEADWLRIPTVDRREVRDVA